MNTVEIINSTNSLQSKLTAGFCKSFLCRLRGFTFRRRIGSDQGLLLVEDADSKVATSIHMIFVFFKLGIVWINENGIVVDTRLAIPFLSFLFPKSPARYILEIHPRRLKEFSIGDKIEFI